MRENTAVLPSGQGPPTTCNQGGSGTHLNHEGGSLQSASPGGRNYPYTSETNRDTRWTTQRGGYYSDSAGPTPGEGRRYI